MKTLKLFSSVSALIAMCLAQNAQGQIFVDDFDNGVLENATSFPSGSPTGFWTYTDTSNLDSTEAVGGPAVLNARSGNTNTITARLQSGVQSAFDFLSNPLTFTGDVSVSADSTTSLNNTGGRFMVSSATGSPGEIDDLLLFQLNVGSGNNGFYMIKRVNSVQTTPLSVVDIGGIAEGFSFTMDATNFSLVFNLVGGGTSSTYTQAHGFTTTNWGTSGSSLTLEAFRGSGSLANSASSFTLNSFEVVPEPGTLALVSMACLGLLVMRRRRA